MTPKQHSMLEVTALSSGIPISPHSDVPTPRLRFRHKPGLVAYVTCGDPDLSTTHEIILAAIAAGADVIELGVPFSDPVADGPVIQRASERALKNGTTLDDVVQLARDVRQFSDAGLVLFHISIPFCAWVWSALVKRRRLRA